MEATLGFRLNGIPPLSHRRHLHDPVGQDGQFKCGWCSSVLPFIGQILPVDDAAQTIVDPLVGMPFLLVDFLHLGQAS